MRSIFVTPYDNDTGVSVDAVLSFHEAVKESPVFNHYVAEPYDYDHANIVCNNEHCNYVEGWFRSENGYRAAIRYIKGGECHACKNRGNNVQQG